MNSLYFYCMGVSESQVSLKESAKPLLCVFVVVVVFADIFKFYIFASLVRLHVKVLSLYIFNVVVEMVDLSFKLV